MSKDKDTKEGLEILGIVFGLLACGGYLGYSALKNDRTGAAHGCLAWVIGVFVYYVVIYACHLIYDPLAWFVAVLPWCFITYDLACAQYKKLHRLGNLAMDKKKFYSDVEAQPEPSAEEIEAYRKLAYKKHNRYMDVSVAVYKLKFWRLYLGKSEYRHVLAALKDYDSSNLEQEKLY